MDAAYAGSAFICPEFQYLLKGIQVNRIEKKKKKSRRFKLTNPLIAEYIN